MSTISEAGKKAAQDALQKTRQPEAPPPPPPPPLAPAEPAQKAQAARVQHATVFEEKKSSQPKVQLASDFTPTLSTPTTAPATAQGKVAQSFQMASLLYTKDPGALLFSADKVSSSQQADPSEKATAAKSTTPAGTKTRAEAERDAQAIAQATSRSPREGAELFEKYLTEEKDEGYRAELIARSKPAIAKMNAPGSSQDEFQKTINAVARATASVPPSQAQEIAGAFASGRPEVSATHPLYGTPDPLASALGVSPGNPVLSPPLALPTSGQPGSGQPTTVPLDPATGTLAYYLSNAYGELDNASMAVALKDKAVTPAAIQGPGSPTGQKTKADAERDAQALREVTNVSPQGGAEMLERLLSEEPNEEYRTALLKASADSLTKMGAAVAKDPVYAKTQGIVGPLGRAAENLTPEQTRLLADGFAAGAPDAKVGPSGENPVLFSLERELQRGDGAAFAYALAQSYADRGNTKMAQALTQTAVEVTNDKRELFEGKKQWLDDEWAKLTASMDPALTKEQREQLYQKFTQQHQGKYAELETIAAELAPLTRDFLNAAKDPKLANDPAIKKHIDAIGKSVPKLAETKAGGELFAKEAEKQEKGQPSLFDGIVEFGEKHFKPATDFLNGMTVALTKGVSLNIMRAAQSGNATAAKNAFYVLEKNAQLFGASQEDLQKALKLFDGIQPGMSKAELERAFETIHLELNKSGTAIPLFDPSSVEGQAFRGVALLFSTALVTDGFSKWEEKDLSERVKLMGESLKLGVDGSTMALEALAQHSEWVDNFVAGGGGVALRGVGAFAGFVVAVGDGITSYKAFREGEHARGFAKGLISAGGVMMSLGAASEIIPGLGQTAGTVLLIAGGTLTAAGTIWDAILGSEDPAKRKKALEEIGITDENVLEGLSNANAQRVSEWQKMGFTPEQMQELARMSPKLLSSSNHEEMIRLQDFSRAHGLSNTQIMDLFRTLGEGGNTDHAAQDFMTGLTGFQVRSGGTIDWAAEMRLRAEQPGGSASSKRVWQNAQRYVNAYGSGVIKPGADY